MIPQRIGMKYCISVTPLQNEAHECFSMNENAVLQCPNNRDSPIIGNGMNSMKQIWIESGNNTQLSIDLFECISANALLQNECDDQRESSCHNIQIY